MKKIMHVIDTRGPGGAETIYLGLIRELSKNKFKSFGVVGGSGYVFNNLKQYCGSATIIPGKGSFNLSYLLKLILFVKQNKIDIIQSHLLGSNVYCSIVGFICRVPVVSTFHGFVDTNSKSKFNWIKFKIINKCSTHVVFVSNALKKEYINQFPLSETKCKMIHNGIDDTPFRKACKKNSRIKFTDNIIIGSVGNIRSAKGYDILLRAAAIVVKKVPQCTFTIAGQENGELYSTLKLLRTKLTLENVVHFTGFCDNVPEFLANIDIFVSSSYSEGFSLSTIEAMACELPIVVTQSGGPEEIITDGETGIIVPINDPAALAGAILLLVENTNYRDNLINKGQVILPQFSFRKTVEQYSLLYR